MEITLRKKPLLFSLVSFLLALPLCWLFMTPINRLIPFYFGEAIKYGPALLVVFGICQETWGKLPFSLERSGFFRGLFSAGLVGIFFSLGALALTWQVPDRLPAFSEAVGFPLSAGMGALAEEFLFRGLIFSVLRNAWQAREHGLRDAIFASSLFFALRQLLDLGFAPGTPVLTLGRTVFALCAGIYLCAVYLRTGNLWVCIFLHFLQNFCAGFFSVLSAGQPEDAAVPAVLLLAGLHLIYVAAAWFLLRRFRPGQNEAVHE